MQGEIDYLMMDYLAEVTMSILQKQKLKNPSLGYAHPASYGAPPSDFTQKKFKVITNGGGIRLRVKRSFLMLQKNLKKPV